MRSRLFPETLYGPIGEAEFNLSKVQNINRNVSETKVFGKFFTITCKKSRNILKTKEILKGLCEFFASKYLRTNSEGLKEFV